MTAEIAVSVAVRIIGSLDGVLVVVRLFSKPRIELSPFLLADFPANAITRGLEDKVLKLRIDGGNRLSCGGTTQTLGLIANPFAVSSRVLELVRWRVVVGLR